MVLVADVFDRRHAAGDAQELPGRVDLEGADRQQQRRVGRSVGAESVIDVKSRLAALPRCVRGDRQIRPLYAGYRQIAFRERRLRWHVVPCQQPSARVEKRLDRVATFFRLDGSINVEQRFIRVAIDADDGPVRLLVVEVAGIVAAIDLPRDVREEIVA